MQSEPEELTTLSESNEAAERRKLIAAGVRVPPKDAWLETFGWAKDDPHYEAAMRAGAEWRARENARWPDAAP